MATFAEDLFGGSRTLRGSVFLLAVLTLALFISMPAEENLQGWVARLAVEAVLVLLALAMAAPHRFHWAGRVLCGLVFAAYLAYLGELFFGEGPIDPSEDGPSKWFTAILGAVMIGLPALIYALTPRRDEDPTETSSLKTSQ